MATPKHRNHYTWGHEIYNFGRGFLACSTQIFTKIFKIKNPLKWESGHEISGFLSLYHILNLVEISMVVFEKMKLIYNVQRQTQTNAKGHLSDSGNLKKSPEAQC